VRVIEPRGPAAFLHHEFVHATYDGLAGFNRISARRSPPHGLESRLIEVKPSALTSANASSDALSRRVEGVRKNLPNRCRVMGAAAALSSLLLRSKTIVIDFCQSPQFVFGGPRAAIAIVAFLLIGQL